MTTMKRYLRSFVVGFSQPFINSRLHKTSSVFDGQEFLGLRGPSSKLGYRITLSIVSVPGFPLATFG